MHHDRMRCDRHRRHGSKVLHEVCGNRPASDNLIQTVKLPKALAGVAFRPVSLPKRFFQ